MMNTRTDLVQVSQEEFRKFVRKHKLSPNGFQLNGEYVQTRFRDREFRERARYSCSLSVSIYEIEPSPPETP